MDHQHHQQQQMAVEEAIALMPLPPLPGEATMITDEDEHQPSSPPAGAGDELTSSSAKRPRDDTSSLSPDSSPTKKTKKTHRQRWQEMYEALNSHGTGPINRFENPRLYAWLASQKSAYRRWCQGKPTFMTAERAAQLEPWFAGGGVETTNDGSTSNNNNGPIISKTNEQKWQAKFQQLQAYKAQNGDCLVPNAHANRQLVKWVDRQRSHYKLLLQGRKSHMTSARVEALQQVGFVFSLRNHKNNSTTTTRSRWEDRLAELKDYKQRHGHVNVPYDTPLGRWVSKQVYQLRQFQRGTVQTPMTDERRQQLEPVLANENGQLRSNAAKWNDWLELLKQYKAQHGDCLVPYDYQALPALSKWVDRQRYWYKKLQDGKPSQMTQERVQQLQQVGFVFSLRANDETEGNDENKKRTSSSPSVARPKWQERYQQLVEFKARTGHVQVPSNFPENPPLAKWLQKQKSQMRLKAEGKPSQLTDELQAKLQAIGVTFCKQGSVWLARLEQLRAYKQQHGHCRVPYNYTEDPALAKWVEKQRSEMSARTKGRKSQLTEERIALLHEVGFCFDARTSKKAEQATKTPTKRL